MIPVELTLTLTRGDSFEESYRLRDLDPEVLFTLTGMTGLAQIRLVEDAPGILTSFTVTLMDQTAVPGGFTLSLTPTEAAALPPGKAVSDVQFSNAGVTVRETYVKFDITVEADTTK